jgi:hypothetical protein
MSSWADGQFRLVIDGEMIGAVPRTTTREVHRFKAYARPSAPAPEHARPGGPSAMTEISATTQIAASPQAVWAVLADLASYPQWNPLFREASGQLSAGNKITLKSIHPVNGRTMTVKASVLAAEPGTELRWRSSLPGIITGEHSFTLTPAEGGGTCLVQTETYSGLLGRFSAKTTGRFEASFQALNQALKERAENPAGNTGLNL